MYYTILRAGRALPHVGLDLLPLHPILRLDLGNNNVTNNNTNNNNNNKYDVYIYIYTCIPSSVSTVEAPRTPQIIPLRVIVHMCNLSLSLSLSLIRTCRVHVGPSVRGSRIDCQRVYLVALKNEDPDPGVQELRASDKASRRIDDACLGLWSSRSGAPRSESTGSARREGRLDVATPER